MSWLPKDLFKSTLWANSADDKLIFFLFLPETTLMTFHAIVSYGDNICMKFQSLFFGGKNKKYFKLPTTIMITLVAVLKIWIMML